jgi:hypothetical protein
MIRRRKTWRLGAAIGLLVALFVLVGVLAGWVEGRDALADAVRYLGATPLLAFDLVRDAGDAGQWIALFVWWILVGAALGWALGHASPGGAAFGAVLALAVIAGHSQTHFTLEKRLDDAVRGIEREFKSILED